MKTLEIERPAHLKEMKREINWVEDFGGEPFDLRTAPRHILEQTIVTCYQLGGGPTAVGNFLLAKQLLDGVLVVVDDGVSRDLEVSRVIGNLENLAWPAEIMEMRFKDPDLPAVIVCPEGGESSTGERVVAFGASNKEGAMMTLALPESKWQEYVLSQDNPAMEAVLSSDLKLDDGEGMAMRYMAMLAIKVIAYSSVPAHKPTKLTTRAERKAAGLHPKHVREGEVAYSVRYLPRIIRPAKGAGEAPGGHSRTFLGRAGHIRYFRSDFYKNLKGQWQWMPPIPPPEGVRVTYKIRSVKP